MTDPDHASFANALRGGPPQATPAVRLPLAGGETVDLPAVPPLDVYDVQGWSGHVRALMRCPVQPLHPLVGQPGLLGQDHGIAGSLLALGNVPRPTTAQTVLSSLQNLLLANVSTTPGSSLMLQLSAGMQEALIGLLLARGTPVDEADLATAVRHASHVRLVQRLLDAAATPERDLSPSLIERSPHVLHHALRNRHPAGPAIVEHLIKGGASLTQLNTDGFSPVGEAVEQGNLLALEVLLHHRAPVDDGPVEALHPSPNTLVHRYAQPAITPLFHAIVANRADLMRPLLAAGARRVNVDHDGVPRSACEVAVNQGANQALALLIAEGEDPLAPRPWDAGVTLLDRAKAARDQWHAEAPGHQLCVNLLEAFELRRTLSPSRGPGASAGPDRSAGSNPVARARL